MFFLSSYGIEQKDIPISFLPIELDSSQLEPLTHQIDDDSYVPKHRKLKAALLTVFLGPFGVHRIYLGTQPNVPVVYSLTLGGLGILPIIDLVSILSAKEIDRFVNEDRVIMWTNPPSSN